MSREVQSMFSRIARRYDAANTFLSFGMHYRWRKSAVARSNVPAGGKVLDLACGTGDFALSFWRAVAPSGMVVAADFSRQMLLLAKEKLRETPINPGLADAMRLPFKSGAFDICSIAFGIRNVDSPLVAMREILRILAPGGKMVILEFGQPRGLFGAIYRFYSRRWIPLLGGFISGDRQAYSYLHATSSAFPSGENFARIMRDAGSKKVETHPLLRGAVYLYIGSR